MWSSLRANRMALSLGMFSSRNNITLLNFMAFMWNSISSCKSVVYLQTNSGKTLSCLATPNHVSSARNLCTCVHAHVPTRTAIITTLGHCRKLGIAGAREGMENQRGTHQPAPGLPRSLAPSSSLAFCKPSLPRCLCPPVCGKAFEVNFQVDPDVNTAG